MVHESAVDKALKKRPEALTELKYDYQELLEFKRKTRKGTKLHNSIVTVEYMTKNKFNINLELEIRKVILNYYFN